MGSKKVKILIVEDEILLSEQMAAFLNKQYEVVGIAESGEKALNIVKQNPPDLVLMDIELEGILDGIDTAERIQKNLFIPIIYLTKLHGNNTLKRVKKTMPAAYLSKPFKNHDLKYAIENAIYSRQMHPNKKSELAYQPETYSVSVFKNRLFYRSGKGVYHRIFINDIIYVELVNGKSRLTTRFGTINLSVNLKDFFNYVEGTNLVRIQRAFGVNAEYVESFTMTTVILNYSIESNPDEIIVKELAMGPTNKKDLLLKLGMG
jgi:DNA-binding LytR/AlgR family response regulator